MEVIKIIMGREYKKPILKKESQLREITLKSTRPPLPTGTERTKKTRKPKE
jgi:hypothetical protein